MTLSTWAYAALALVVGLLVGSFTNVVVYRVPRGMSVSAPRSFCPRCRRQLTWWENIPVVSWIALGGHCRTCDAPISLRYPLVEGISGLVWGGIALALHGSFVAAPYCVLASTLGAITLIELGGHRTPRSVAAFGTGAALVLFAADAARYADATHLWSAAAGTAVGLVLYSVLAGLDPQARWSITDGRTALIPAGCWLGALPATGLAGGAAAAVVFFGTAPLTVHLLRTSLRPARANGARTCTSTVCTDCTGCPTARGLPAPFALALVTGAAIGLILTA